MILKSLVKNNSKGFTLVELLVVITVIAILSGVVIRVLNIDRQQGEASDAVVRTNIEKAVVGIEAFNAAENTVPVDVNGNGNPIDDTNPGTNAKLSTYIKTWPGNDYMYLSSGNSYEIYAPSSLKEGTYLKYFSVTGSISECLYPTPMGNCNGGAPELIDPGLETR